MWLKAHPLPDEVVLQAIITRAAARKVTDTTPSDSENAWHTQFKSDDDAKNILLLINPVHNELSLYSVTNRTKLVELQKSDNSLQFSVSKLLTIHTILTVLITSYFLHDYLLMHHTLDRKTNSS